jgi:hypothetical protein
MLAGRLDGTVDGRPFALTTRGRTATLRLPSIVTAVRLRRRQTRLPGRDIAATLARRGGLRLRLKVWHLPAVTVFPSPGDTVREPGVGSHRMTA